VLQAEQIPFQILAQQEERANLVARVRGNGSKRPILMTAHTDTVGVEENKWKFSPFSAERYGPHIYGRGTLDDKSSLTAQLMVLILLKRLGVPLERDVIFLAAAGEETGFEGGTTFVAGRHWPAIDAEFCLGEGGNIIRRGGKPMEMRVATAEKIPYALRVMAHGTAGHGSRPSTDNAVQTLSSALVNIAAWRPPIRLNETTRVFFRKLAEISPPEAAERYRALLDPARASTAVEYMAKNQLGFYRLLTTSIVPTMLRAGTQFNVIPSEAEATLDVRALPDEDLALLIAQLRRVVGDDRVTVEPLSQAPPVIAPPSRLDTVLYRALESVQKQMYPEVVTIPLMLGTATDMPILRARGMQCYGVGPAFDFEDLGSTYGAHGDQERILERSVYDLVRFTWSVVTATAAWRQ
jgi:acetylornithine deacetylase/succinyl-diaminopimelate desuccinylase-like protein